MKCRQARGGGGGQKRNETKWKMKWNERREMEWVELSEMKRNGEGGTGCVFEREGPQFPLYGRKNL